MNITDRGLLALVRHEGIVPGPYLDVRQVWTFGIGHTATAGEPDPAKLPRGMPGDLDAGIREAFRIFRADLARCEAEVLHAVTVPIAPHEFDALVSFHYNTGGIARAALTRHLNAGDRDAAAEAFLNWRRPAAIVPRREDERDLFRHGRYPAGTIPVWSVDQRRAGGVLPPDPAAHGGRSPRAAAPGPARPRPTNPRHRQAGSRASRHCSPVSSEGPEPCAMFDHPH